MQVILCWFCRDIAVWDAYSSTPVVNFAWAFNVIGIINYPCEELIARPFLFKNRHRCVWLPHLVHCSGDTLPHWEFTVIFWSELQKIITQIIDDLMAVPCMWFLLFISTNNIRYWSLTHTGFCPEAPCLILPCFNKVYTKKKKTTFIYIMHQPGTLSWG